MFIYFYLYLLRDFEQSEIVEIFQIGEGKAADRIIGIVASYILFRQTSKPQFF